MCHNVYYGGGDVKLQTNLMQQPVLHEDSVLCYDSDVFTDNVEPVLDLNNQLYKAEYHYSDYTVMRVYNKNGHHCYTLSTQDRDEHNDMRGTINVQNNKEKVIMKIMNKQAYKEGNWGDIVYLMGDTDQITGYYLLWTDGLEFGYRLERCAHPPEGYLEVLDVVHCLVSETIKVVDHMTMKSNLDHDPKLVYDNYCKDQQVWQYYQCDYVTYMTKIIDILIGKADQETIDHNKAYDNCSEQMSHEISHKDVSPHMNKLQSLSDVGSKNISMTKSKIKDFNYPDKKVGYLTQVKTDFSFIGPDRAPVELNSIDTLLNIADIIRETGEPNYKCARIPIRSGLQVEAWAKYLEDYSDKRVMQYIKFGFPLSLINPNELNNTEITSHFSACQYPRQVQEYIDKELSLGAMLGPVDSIDHEQFHCSPLLTRPKDIDKRRVILNLSHPYGNSVNSHVEASEFDGSPFILKFPTVDDIARDIVESSEDTVLFKVDVARAFRNLRADPVDSLKFGIYWRGKYYVDVGIACGWTHGSASFQILSDAIAYIMSKEGIQLRCYIDDYIAVVPKSMAHAAFTRLCDVLNELGLPINHDKLTPPTKALTCLGIEFNIENNTMSIAEDKLKAIYAECVEVCTKRSLSKHKYQSLLGKLLYIQKCVKPARVFINRILAEFRSNYQSRTIQLSEEFHKDIQWFLTFLPTYNGISYIHKSRLDVGQSLYLDASLTGMGAVWRNRVYATPIHNCGDLNLKIVHLEMLNIIIALKIWGGKW